MNLIIAACDSMDGKTDGVVARTDLCKLNFNLNSTIGYYCAAVAASTGEPSSPATPVQNGTVSAQAVAVAVAAKILDGLHESQGRHAYVSYQPSTSYYDAVTRAGQKMGYTRGNPG
ncbi:hypothetical protein OCU04_005669 [Sclerotinia nivalis]|uniref:Carboxylic ester hydrolase n=1 Tax=Sclerotinia nivalis TaxID=352851 RepID=A0A9X0APM8_9HELO|nr:hypothetical protein OCU04_005669 [Sclerotinia nivalis]